MSKMSTNSSGHLRALEEAIQKNEVLMELLKRLSELNLPDCYVASGGIAQTVWNRLHRFEPGFGIKDYDVIYYDKSDPSREREAAALSKATRIFKNLPVPVEVVNEANVHLWFEKEFGDPMPRPYASIEDAIGTFSTTAVCIGVRYNNGVFDVCAPYGLDDLFGLLLRRNGKFYTEKRHQEKIDRWTSLWPRLKVIPWDE